MTATEIHEFLTTGPSLPMMRAVLKDHFGRKTFHPTVATAESMLLDIMFELRAQEVSA